VGSTPISGSYVTCSSMGEHWVVNPGVGRSKLLM
jgi:hypothetical protein